MSRLKTGCQLGMIHYNYSDNIAQNALHVEEYNYMPVKTDLMISYMNLVISYDYV